VSDFSAAETALVIEGVSKTYGRRKVVDDVTLTVRRGEIHALLGQNGSGKSTLIRILAGQTAPDPPLSPEQQPSLTAGGVRTQLPITPAESSQRGLVFVHQDLALVPTATVAETLGLGRFCTTRLGRVRWREQEQLTRDVLRLYEVDAQPGTLIRDLSEVDRAIIAIVRGISFLRGEGSSASTLFLDEPTAYLPADATLRFFEVMRDLAREGHAIVFVSHRLDEVLEVCDRASVLRDGRLVETRDLVGVGRSELVQSILGHALDTPARRQPTSNQEPTLEVKNLSGRRVRDVSFDGKRGEILGITGLLGSGFEEIAYLAFGAVHGTGTVTIEGREHVQSRLTPKRAIALGMGLLPADRRSLSGVQRATSAENLALAATSQRPALSRLRADADHKAADGYMRSVGVQPIAPDALLATFSGGNQQRILFMKWLTLNPKLLWLHEPTHGVDVGAKAALHRLITQAADDGCCIVIASTEYEDLAEMCDRVLVLHNGRLSTQLAGADLNHRTLLQACMSDVGGRHAG